MKLKPRDVMQKVILDTNVVVSALIQKSYPLKVKPIIYYRKHKRLYHV